VSDILGIKASGLLPLMSAIEAGLPLNPWIASCMP